jgi:hypothetical protein
MGCVRANARAGVPAGVCQTAEDRYEHDPQLRHHAWLTELEQSETGKWPVKEVPVKFSETPPYIGGFLDRHGPSYGEDNGFVLRTILGLDQDEIAGGWRAQSQASCRPRAGVAGYPDLMDDPPAAHLVLAGQAFPASQAPAPKLRPSPARATNVGVRYPPLGP